MNPKLKIKIKIKIVHEVIHITNQEVDCVLLPNMKMNSHLAAHSNNCFKNYKIKL